MPFERTVTIIVKEKETPPPSPPKHKLYKVQLMVKVGEYSGWLGIYVDGRKVKERFVNSYSRVYIDIGKFTGRHTITLKYEGGEWIVLNLDEIAVYAIYEPYIMRRVYYKRNLGLGLLTTYSFTVNIPEYITE